MTVQGYAIAGAGRTVSRVEVSTDGGAAWTEATLVGEPSLWAWRFWELTLPLGAGRYELAARAHDSGGATQPSDPGAVWNFKGYMNNAWHRVPIEVTDA